MGGAAAGKTQAIVPPVFHPSELLQWARIRLNRPDARDLDEPAFWSLYEHDGQALVRAPPALTERAGVALLFVVTTYQRPDACAHLLSALGGALDALTPRPSALVLVLNDRGTRDYADARAEASRAFGGDLVWLDARARLGKPGFWKVYQTAFLAARALRPGHTFFLQDDLEFDRTMVAHALAHFGRVGADDTPLVLNLFSSNDDEPRGRWVRFRRRDAGEGLRLTQWFDLNGFLVDQRFFALLDYKMIPIHANRWRRRPRISSGVGAQLTRRLFSRGNVYQAAPPLVFHGAYESEMNAEARRRRTLDNRAERPPRAR